MFAHWSNARLVEISGLTGMNEEQYFKKLLGKYVKISKRSNNLDFIYRGIVKGVLKNKLILEDIKIGEIAVEFDGLSVLNIKHKGRI